MRSEVFCLKIVIVIFMLILVSCGNKKQRSVYIDLDNSASTSYSSMVVPFKEEGGVKYVHVKVNGVGWDMTILRQKTSLLIFSYYLLVY